MALPFTYAPGTNGFTTTPFTVLTTELNAVTTGSLSTLGAAKSQSTTGNAIWGYVWFTFGGAVGVALSAGANLSVWWINSTDGGTTFEASGAAPPRTPDVVIPLPATTIASGAIYFAPGIVRLWAPSVKVILQNNTGQTLPATSNTLTVGPIEMQY
jgi:hypothetical protein